MDSSQIDTSSKHVVQLPREFKELKERFEKVQEKRSANQDYDASQLYKEQNFFADQSMEDCLNLVSFQFETTEEEMKAALDNEAVRNSDNFPWNILKAEFIQDNYNEDIIKIVMILKRYLEPKPVEQEPLRHPSSKIDGLGNLINTEIRGSQLASFFDTEKHHFLLYELGFNALTLVLADYNDYKQACGHYIAITLTMEAALEKLEVHLTEQAHARLFEAVFHRRKMVSLIDLIKKNTFVKLRNNVKYIGYVLNLLKIARVHYYSVGKFLVQEHEQLKKAIEKAYEYTSLDNMLFRLVNPSVERQLKLQDENMIKKFLKNVAVTEQHILRFRYMFDKIAQDHELQEFQIPADVMLEDNFIRITGFKHDPRIKAYYVDKEPTFDPIGNYHQYFVYYQLKPKPGEHWNLKHLHTHSCSFARIAANVVLLDGLSLGSGQLLLQFMLRMKPAIKKYAEKWRNIYFAELNKSRVQKAMGLNYNREKKFPNESEYSCDEGSMQVEVADENAQNPHEQLTQVQNNLQIQKIVPKKRKSRAKPKGNGAVQVRQPSLTQVEEHAEEIEFTEFRTSDIRQSSFATGGNTKRNSKEESKRQLTIAETLKQRPVQQPASEKQTDTAKKGKTPKKLSLEEDMRRHPELFEEFDELILMRDRGEKGFKTSVSKYNQGLQQKFRQYEDYLSATSLKSKIANRLIKQEGVKQTAGIRGTREERVARDPIYVDLSIDSLLGTEDNQNQVFSQAVKDQDEQRHQYSQGHSIAYGDDQRQSLIHDVSSSSANNVNQLALRQQAQNQNELPPQANEERKVMQGQGNSSKVENNMLDLEDGSYNNNLEQNSTNPNDNAQIRVNCSGNQAAQLLQIIQPVAGGEIIQRQVFDKPVSNSSNSGTVPVVNQVPIQIAQIVDNPQLLVQGLPQLGEQIPDNQVLPQPNISQAQSEQVADGSSNQYQRFEQLLASDISIPQVNLAPEIQCGAQVGVHLENIHQSEDQFHLNQPSVSLQPNSMSNQNLFNGQSLGPKMQDQISFGHITELPANTSTQQISFSSRNQMNALAIFRYANQPADNNGVMVECQKSESRPENCLQVQQMPEESKREELENQLSAANPRFETPNHNAEGAATEDKLTNSNTSNHQSQENSSVAMIPRTYTWDSLWDEPVEAPVVTGKMYMNACKGYNVEDKDDVLFELWLKYAYMRRDKGASFIDWDDVNTEFFKKASPPKFAQFEKDFKIAHQAKLVTDFKPSG